MKRRKERMEICYVGALVMPNSYVVMDEEEILYVEGGMSVHRAAKYINIGVTAILVVVGIGLGISSILWFMRNSGKGLVVAGLKHAITSVILALNPNWTIGYGIAIFIDSRDSNPNNKIVMG